MTESQEPPFNLSGIKHLASKIDAVITLYEDVIIFSGKSPGVDMTPEYVSTKNIPYISRFRGDCKDDMHIHLEHTGYIKVNQNIIFDCLNDCRLFIRMLYECYKSLEERKAIFTLDSDLKEYKGCIGTSVSGLKYSIDFWKHEGVYIPKFGTLAECVGYLSDD